MNGLFKKIVSIFIACTFALSIVPLGSAFAYAVGGDAVGAAAIPDQAAASEATDSSASADSSPLKLRAGYVYVDEADIEAGETQQIVIALDDDSASVSSAQLTYTTPKGVEETIDSIATAGPAMRFELETARLGEYEMLRVAGMLDNGGAFEVDLKVSQAEEYTFEASEPSTSLYALSNDSSGAFASVEDVSIYAMDDDGDLLEAASVDEAAAVSLSAASTTSRFGFFVVALDPGHGGTDSGATGYGLKECDINWKIAQYCKEELEKYFNVSVYLTRKENECPGLTERAQRAKDAGASVFVSLHINSAGSTAYGAEVYYPNQSSYQHEAHVKGKQLSEKILAQLTSLGLYDRGVKVRDGSYKYSDGYATDYYTVIQASRERGIPGIIVEHAFISNASDAAKLADNSFLKKLGVADATGIAQTFGLTKGGWEQQSDGSWKFKRSDQSYAKSEWLYINGEDYYFNSNGIAVTGFQMIGGKKYYFDSLCAMKYGWQKINNKWYYFGPAQDGAMRIGWEKLDGRWYYFDASGIAATGFQTVDGKKYYFDSSCAMLIGWQKIGGKWYYFNRAGEGTEGAMRVGWQTINNVKYYFDLSTGAMQTGWGKVDGKRYYFNKLGEGTEGALRAAGWQRLEGAWYYLDPSTGAAATGHTKVGDAWYYLNTADQGTEGLMRTGWVKDGSKWYYFNGSGARLSGWHVIGGAWYHFDPSTGEMATGHKKVGTADYFFGGADDGAMKTGWAKDGSKWYYFNGSGARLSGWHVIGGAWYHFDPSTGEMATGHKKVGTADYFFGGADDGAMKTGWAKDGSKWYYFAGSGARVSGWQTLGARYFFNEDGAMQSGWKKLDGKWYFFGGANDGAMKTGWAKDGSTWYYLNPGDGVMKTGWIQLGGIWYYLKPDNGAMVTGQCEIDGKAYSFDSSGAWLGEGSAIMGAPLVTEAKLVEGYNAFCKKTGKTYPSVALGKGGASTIEQYCHYLYQEAVDEGVRPEVVWAQIMNETGFLQFGGDVKIEQFNFGGIGATGNGAPGNSFKSVQEGIRAQVQHLKAYGSKEPLKKAQVDPRFQYVTRGCAPTAQELSMKWAMSETYGKMLVEQYMYAYLGVR